MTEEAPSVPSSFNDNDQHQEQQQTHQDNEDNEEQQQQQQDEEQQRNKKEKRKRKSRRFSQFKNVEMGGYIDEHNHEFVPIIVIRESTLKTTSWFFRNRFNRLFKYHPPVISVLIIAATFLTYALANNKGVRINRNIAAFAVTIMAGNIVPEWTVHVAMGANGGLVSDETIPRYSFLLLFASIAAVLWLLALRYQFMIGWAGRLGSLSFVACNVTVLIVAAVGDVPWTVFADSSSLWGEVVDWKSALLTIFCAVFASTLAAIVRCNSQTPLNAVAAASATGMLPMLCLEVSGYTNRDYAIIGLGIGSRVGMASFERIRSVLSFAIVGLLAGGWFVFLQPFFVGFGGKQGFTAMLGFVLYDVLLFCGRKIGKCVWQTKES